MQNILTKPVKVIYGDTRLNLKFKQCKTNTTTIYVTNEINWQLESITQNFVSIYENIVTEIRADRTEGTDESFLH